MYIGHAAIALVLKARRPAVPMLPLVLAAYGPDWIDVGLMVPRAREGMAPYSHSIPAVVFGAIIAALVYEAIARRPGAWLIAGAWLSHYPADLITGLKPILGVTPVIGLDAYHIPALDYAIELLLMTFAIIGYASAFASARRQRILVAALWVALSLAQAVVDVAVARLDPSGWSPSLADGPWRPHVTELAGPVRQLHILHGSCTARLHSQGSETCRRREQPGWLRSSA